MLLSRLCRVVSGQRVFDLARAAGLESARRARRRIRSGPLYTWRPSGAVPNGLKVVPASLRPAHAERAAQLYAGTFAFDGEVHALGAGDIFASETWPAKATTHWQARLNGFGWLRHLDAAATPLSRIHGSAAMLDWIEQWEERFQPLVWRGDVAARRAMSFLRFGVSLMEEDANRWRLMKSLARHLRYLQHNAGLTRDGEPRLVARLSLVMLCLCLEGRERGLDRALKALERELDRQIAPDGGHISRDPAALMRLLSDLLPLRDAMRECGLGVPAKIVSHCERMGEALSLFIHRNKQLAQFNGTGAVEPAWLDAVVSAAEIATSRAPRYLPQSGYDRLTAGRTTLIMDTARATSPVSAPDLAAGTLAFEMSSGGSLFIANCGKPDAPFAAYRTHARTSAAHSTAILADTSSSTSTDTGLFAGALAAILPGSVLTPPANVTRERKDGEDGTRTVEASHDGYLGAFGIIHRRQITLHADGSGIDGSDRFEGRVRSASDSRQTSKPGLHGKPVPMSIRFHIPPGISATFLSSGHSVLLAASGGDAWTFTCVDLPVSLEESIRFAGRSPGEAPRKCMQIALHGDLEPGTDPHEIRWVLRRKLKARRAADKPAQPTQETLMIGDDPQPDEGATGPDLLRDS